MKLKGNYSNASAKSLVFMNAGQEGIALEFAHRLAAFFSDKGKTGYISSGYRDVAKQKILYDANCKEHPPSGNGMVAKPGSSWHNGRCAVDLDDRNFWQAYMTTGDMHKTAKKQELYKYGLCLPLNYVDAHTIFEWWHIQPIETLGHTGNRVTFLDVDDKIYNPKEVVPIEKPITPLEAVEFLFDNKILTNKVLWLKKAMVDKDIYYLMVSMINKLKGGK